MNLTNVTIAFNPYDWKSGNTEPNSFGGIALFEGALGEMRAQLSDTTIRQILALVAPDAIASLHGAAMQVTTSSIVNAGQFCLTHTSEEPIEEIIEEAPDGSF